MVSKNLLFFSSLVLCLFFIGGVSAVETCDGGSCGSDEPGYFNCTDTEGVNDGTFDSGFPQSYYDITNGGTVSVYGSGTFVTNLKDVCHVNSKYLYERYCIELGNGQGAWQQHLVQCPGGTICDEDSSGQGRCISADFPSCEDGRCNGDYYYQNDWYRDVNCTDTDGYNRDWVDIYKPNLTYVNRYIPGHIIFNGVSVKDICSGNYVTDRYCWEDSQYDGTTDTTEASLGWSTTAWFLCPNGCESQDGMGYCVSDCVDSDGGDENIAQGTATGGRYPFDESTDSCSGNVLTEYYCSADGVGVSDKTYSCDSNCYDGACCDSATWSEWSVCAGAEQTRVCQRDGLDDSSPICASDCVGVDTQSCTVETCSDGVQNQGETGEDCGGPCPACVACGDGTREGAEECDLTDFDMVSCLSSGFLGGGDLICNGDCTINTSECSDCVVTEAGVELTCDDVLDNGNGNDNDCNGLANCADPACGSDPACGACVLDDWRAFWIDASGVEVVEVNEGAYVRLVLENEGVETGCSGRRVLHTIYEQDLISRSLPSFTGNSPTAFELSVSGIGNGGDWAAEWTNDAIVWGEDDPEYVFEACLESDITECADLSGQLTVIKLCGNGICDGGETYANCDTDCPDPGACTRPACAANSCGTLSNSCGNTGCGPCGSGETCSDDNECVSKNIYWRDLSGAEIQSASVRDTVEMFVTNMASAIGTAVTFEIYEEDDSLLDPIDDFIGSVEGVIDGDNSAFGHWTITSNDLLITDGDYDDFYFIVDGEESERIDISPVDEDDPMDIRINSPDCGSNYDVGQDVHIEVIAEDDDDIILGNLSFDGEFVTFGNGGISINHVFASAGNYQIYATGRNSRGRVWGDSTSIMVVDSSDADYVAACIDKPEYFSDIPGTNVDFLATSSKGLRCVSGSCSNLGIDDLSFHWTFSDGEDERTVLGSADPLAYDFTKVFRDVGYSSATLEVEVVV